MAKPNTLHPAPETKPIVIPEPFGPNYNIDNASLRKFRRDSPDRKAYGAAVLSAVLASQAAQLRRVGATPKLTSYVSGTAHSTGEAILKAMQAQHRAELAAYPAQVRRDRTPQQWREMYWQAMAEKLAVGAPSPKVPTRKKKRPQSAA